MRGGWQKNAPKKTLICKECHVEFLGVSRDWCSHNCYGKWRRKNDHAWRKARKQYERDWKYQRDRKDPEEPGLYQARRLAKLRIEKPWYILLRTIKSGAKRRGLDFDLTFEWARLRWTGRCELTGIEFSTERYNTRRVNPMWASVDRIDNNKGYVHDNCRIILHCINTFKNTMTDAQMIDVAKALVLANEIKRAA